MSITFTSQRLIIIFSICLLPYLLSAQKITSFSPVSGRIGTTVTIAGTGFNAIAGNNTVYFGAAKAVVTSASATQLVVTSPIGATFQPITVTTGGLTAYSSRPFIPTFGCAPDALTANSFGSKLNFSPGTFSSPISIAIADFDGDGKPDIASTGQDNSSVSVFRNISTSSELTGASFAAPVNFLTDAGPAGIVAGDFDGDGKTDIAITTTSNTVVVLRNTTSPGIINAGSFAFSASLATSNGPTDDAQTSNIAVGDLDVDGKPDIVVTSTNKNVVSIFRNLSTVGTITSNTFSTRIDIATGVNPLGLLVTDIDGDGRPEIVVNSVYGFSMTIYRNISTPGTLSTASFASGVNFTTSLGTAGLAAGDLNNDGKPEIILTNTLAGSISIYPNNAVSGSINSSTLRSGITLSAPTNPITVVISDFNGDGKPDIAVASYDINATTSNNNPLSLYVNNISGSTISSGSFLPRVDMITGGSLGKFAVGDLDADGKPELVIPNYTSDAVYVLKNNASIFTALPASTVNGLNTVCDDGVWKNFYDPAASTRIICSIRDNGNSLGNTNASVYVDAGPTKYNGTSFLGRHYVINPSAQPSSNVQVRLYFTQAEFNALQVQENRLSSPEDLSITKYQGPTEDGVFSPADATSISIIPPASIRYGTAFGGYYAEITVSGLSEFWFNYGNVVLPVQLLYFKAEAAGDAVSLQWSTASETNNDFFTAERSADGINFSTVTTVKAAGSSTQPHVYEVKDAAPIQGVNYYRLKQTDKDGKFSYSDVKVVQWDGAGTLRVVIAPQPMKAQSTVSFFAKTGTTNFIVYNAQGSAVQSYRLNRITNGNAQLTIQKDRLSAGVYFYKIFNGSQEVYHGKLIVE